MAKHPGPKSGGTSKFRMVIIDAELQDGEIGQLAQAIQGAFGGQRVIASKLGVLPTRSLPSPNADEGPPELEEAEEPGEAQPAVGNASPAKPKAQKKIRVPNLDSELHPGESPTLKAYAEARNITNASSVLTKFLVIAAWLHEERSGMKITADRAYTCFRFVGWSFNIDFDQPLRDMKSKTNFVALKPEDKGKGEFTITHLGLDKATKMKNGE